MNKKQKQAIEQYESISGFEYMHKTELRKKEMTFEETWQSNVTWLESVLADVINIKWS